jgi:hypothetical protein
MKKVKIYYESIFIKEVVYDEIRSEAIERAWIFGKNKMSVAIVPYHFLMIFENENEKQVKEL